MLLNLFVEPLQELRLSVAALSGRLSRLRNPHRTLFSSLLGSGEAVPEEPLFQTENTELIQNAFGDQSVLRAMSPSSENLPMVRSHFSLTQRNRRFFFILQTVSRTQTEAGGSNIAWQTAVSSLRKPGIFMFDKLLVTSME